jgi:hypothetical protein
LRFFPLIIPSALGGNTEAEQAGLAEQNRIFGKDLLTRWRDRNDKSLYVDAISTRARLAPKSAEVALSQRISRQVASQAASRHARRNATHGEVTDVLDILAAPDMLMKHNAPSKVRYFAFLRFCCFRLFLFLLPLDSKRGEPCQNLLFSK